MNEAMARSAATAQVTLAVLGVIAVLYWMQAILVPIALAFFLSTMMTPLTMLLRRYLKMSPLGSAVALFLMLLFAGLYGLVLTSESLQAMANTLPVEINRMTGQLSNQVARTYQQNSPWALVLPEPSTIDQFGDYSAMTLDTMRNSIQYLAGWVAQGIVILCLILFLLAESEALSRKVIRFISPDKNQARASEHALRSITRQIRSYLLTRTWINLAVGLVLAGGFWMLSVRYALLLAAFAGLTNYIPYLGNIVAGIIIAFMTLSQTGSLGDVFLVVSLFVLVVGVEGYVLTPYVMGRSLDLNGTTVLIACLFWGFIWGLAGLILAVPITASLKLIFQNVPSLHGWADLMSQTWERPTLDSEASTGITGQFHRPSSLPPGPQPEMPSPTDIASEGPDHHDPSSESHTSHTQNNPSVYPSGEPS